MICVICRQAETRDGRTAVVFERDEFRLRVNSVPARICPDCGETYVEALVAAELLRIARQTFGVGILDVEGEYGSFQV